MNDELKAVYKGDGLFLQGIPARDLRAAEWEGLTDEQRQLVQTSGLYLIEPDKKSKPAPRQTRGTEKDGE